MTSQENEMTMDVDALKAKARELGVSGWQACKDAEKLQAKIDAALESGNKRKKPPKMAAALNLSSDREVLIRHLEREDPDSKYLTYNAKLTPSEAEAKGFEIVKKDNGDVMYCKNDIVVRTDKESYYQWQNNRTAGSLKSMRSIDKDLQLERGGRKIQAFTESAKQGIDPDEE